MSEVPEARIVDAMRSSNDGERTVICYICVEGYQYGETAKFLKIPRARWRLASTTDGAGYARRWHRRRPAGCDRRTRPDEDDVQRPFRTSTSLAEERNPCHAALRHSRRQRCSAGACSGPALLWSLVALGMRYGAVAGLVLAATALTLELVAVDCGGASTRTAAGLAPTLALPPTRERPSPGATEWKGAAVAALERRLPHCVRYSTWAPVPAG